MENSDNAGGDANPSHHRQPPEGASASRMASGAEEGESDKRAGGR